MPNPIVTINTGSDIGAVAGAVKSGLDLAGYVVKAEDSPEMLAAKFNVSLQEAKDHIAKNNKQALKTGNVANVDADLS